MRSSRFSIFKALVSAVVILVSIVVASAQQRRQQDIDLQAAIRTETVDGDLTKAIRQYEAIATKYKTDRAIAATALVHMAECYQKLGDAQARKLFEQVLREYGDQKEPAALARARLGEGSASTTAKRDRAVWTGPGVGNTGTISSDGRLLSYVVSDGNLGLHDLTTGTARKLTNQGYASGEFHDGFSAVSRDGKHVAYVWWGDKKRVELRVVDTQGSGFPPARRLLEREDINSIKPFDWSPDGRWIAVQLGRTDGSGQIAMVGATEGTLRVLKSVNWNGSSRIYFSPDGRYITYDLASDDTGRHRNILVLAVDGSRETTVFEDASAVMGWSPDSKYLLFSRGSGLWALPVDDGKPQGSPALLRPDSGGGSLGITSSGALYTTKAIIDYQVRVASIDWNSGKFVSAPSSQQEPPGAVSLLPSWSPDGKLLAYGYNNGFIKIRSIQTGESRELRPSMQYFNNPRWSPDGRSFLAAGRDLKGRNGVYQIDAHTGAASLLIAGSINLQDPDGNAVPVWSPDSKFIYFRRMDKIMERDLASGKDREVFRGGQGQFKVSPDGRYVAATDGLSADAKTCSTLLLIPISGGDAKELLRVSRPEGIPPSWSLEWMPDSTAIVVIKHIGERRELWQVPITGSQPRKLDIDLSSWANPASGFSIHPDGRQVAFTAGKNALEIWALEHFLPTASARK